MYISMVLGYYATREWARQSAETFTVYLDPSPQPKYDFDFCTTLLLCLCQTDEPRIIKDLIIIRGVGVDRACATNFGARAEIKKFACLFRDPVRCRRWWEASLF